MLLNFKSFAICTAFYAFGYYVFPPSYMKTEEFWESGPLYTLFYTVVSITALRFKYYSGWKVGMFSVHASGVSYSAGEHFTNIEHCKPEIIETTPHVREKINNWNIMVQDWLRKCIYMRSPFKSRMHSQLYVFMISAFWHGYYAGYYFSFFFWFVLLYLQGLVFKYTKYEGNFLSKIYDSLGKAGPFITSIISNIFFSHNATFFYLLEASLCFKLMQKMYFLPQLLLFVFIVVLMVIPAPKKKNHQHKE